MIFIDLKLASLLGTKMTEKKFLSVEEVAKRFQVNPTTIYRLAQKGHLPGFKVGGQWRFSPEMLEAWIEDRVRMR